MKIFNANVLLALAILIGCVFFFFFEGDGTHPTGGRLLEVFGKDKELPNGKSLQDLQQQIDVLTMNLTDLGAMINGRAHELQAQLDTLVAEVQENGGDFATIQEQQKVHDELIATLTGGLMDLMERVRLNEEDVEDALELLASTLNLAVNAIDARLVALEADIDTVNGTIVTNADGVAANAAAILQADQGLQHKVTLLESAIAAVAGVATTNADSISDLKTTLSDTKAELALKQNRVGSVCPRGSSIRAINADGTVACETGDATAGLPSYTGSLYLTRWCYYFSGGYYYEYHSGAAYCASGYTATGGGFFVSNSAFQIQYNIPYGETGWYVQTHSYYGYNSGYVHAYARCTKTI